MADGHTHFVEETVFRAVLLALNLLNDKADRVHAELMIDTDEYLADLYCLERAAVLISWDLLLRAHRMVEEGDPQGLAAEVLSQTRRIKAVRKLAFKEAGEEEAGACINIRQMQLQQHQP